MRAGRVGLTAPVQGLAEIEVCSGQGVFGWPWPRPGDDLVGVECVGAVGAVGHPVAHGDDVAAGFADAAEDGPVHVTVLGGDA